MMQKKVLSGVIIIALIFSMLSVVQRVSIEKNNRNVDLIMDNQALFKLKNNIDGKTTIEHIYSQLEKNGLTGIAIYQDKLQDYINDNKVRLLQGNELLRIRELTGKLNPVYKKYDFTQDSSFLIVTEKSLQKRIATMISSWSTRYNFDYKSINNGSIIFFPEWKDKYLNLSLGFNKNVISNIKNAGLNIIPRFSNKKGERLSEYAKNELDNLAADLIIFSGEEVSGFPDDIKGTAQIMKENKIRFGMIEPFIAKQNGADKLARSLGFNLIRVHSIQQGEMAKYSMSKVVDRYLRAVRERDVRVLYLKPFLEEKDDINLLDLNKTYLSKLTNDLKEQGYNIGKAQPYSQFGNSYLYLILIGMGVIIAGTRLLEYLLEVKLNRWNWIILIAGIFVIGVMLKSGQEVLTRQLLALASSIIFPSLAVISQLLNSTNSTKFKDWILSFLKAGGISLVGAIFLVGSLDQISFLVKVNQFRGVKFAFIIPLIFISYYYFIIYLPGNSEKNSLEIIGNFLNIEIRVKHIILGLIMGMGAVVYITRTGNYSLLPVSGLEKKFRVLLEHILYVRPRFKEFLLGHPFLVASLSLKDKLKANILFYPLIILATIGQVTILNTFSHIHTPFIISLIRVFHGYWLGLILGLILTWIIRYMYRLFNNSLEESE